MASRPELICIVGETASGKSALALMVAEAYAGEIICADSRTIYRYMNIGTAKPSEEEQKRIQHHMLDIIEPGKPFTAADFKRRAEAVIADIISRGKVPILVGGSGLYVDSILFDFQFGNQADERLRAELELLTIEQLQERILAAGFTMPENSRNKRYLIRTLERGGAVDQPRRLRPNTLVIGLMPDRETLKARIKDRAEHMLDDGVIAETKELIARYGENCEQFKGNIYEYIVQHLQGSLDREAVVEQTVFSDLRLAKKQRTWFKRNHAIQWFESQSEALMYIQKFL